MHVRRRQRAGCCVQITSLSRQICQQTFKKCHTCLHMFALNGKKEVHDHFLFCDKLHTTITAEVIFGVMDHFMTSNKISWANCIAVYTNGGVGMTVKHSGVVQQIKAVAPRVASTHSFFELRCSCYKR